MNNVKRKKKKPRGQGESNEQGVTKSLILVYIANEMIGEEGPDQDDVILHIKRTSGISSKQGIQNLINGLVKDGVLDAEIDTKGDTRLKLKTGFENFHSIFDSIHERKCSTEFIQTPYYLRLLEDNEFKVKLILNTLKNTLLHLFEYPRQDRNMRELLIECRSIAGNSSQPDVITSTYNIFADIQKTGDDGRLKTGRPSNEWSTMILYLLQFLKNHDIDSIYDKIHDEISPQILDSLLTIIPAKEKEEISVILQCSPSAMDIVLNSTGYDPIRIATSTLGYYAKALKQDAEKMALINEMSRRTYDSISKEEAINAAIKLTDFSNLRDNSPIIVPLRSAMSQDYYNGRLVDNRFSKQFIARHLSPVQQED